MPSYKLIYFEAKGRGELTRMLFAYGNVAYTDERIKTEDWPARKQTLPYPKVPILMVDDKPLPQSIAISRYVAKEVGLVPADNLQAAYCDAMVDTLGDIVQANYKIIFSGKSEEEQEKMCKEDFYPNVLEPILTRMEKRLSEKQWFVGDKETWADVAVAVICGGLKQQRPFLFDNHPKVCAHVKKVESLPGIKEWVEKRPVTKF